MSDTCPSCLCLACLGISQPPCSNLSARIMGVTGTPLVANSHQLHPTLPTACHTSLISSWTHKFHTSEIEFPPLVLSSSAFSRPVLLLGWSAFSMRPRHCVSPVVFPPFTHTALVLTSLFPATYHARCFLCSGFPLILCPIVDKMFSKPKTASCRPC